MIPHIPSRATQCNPKLKYVKRGPRQDNVRWLQNYVSKRSVDGPLVLLLGGVDELSIRIRTAQSHTRSDMTASPWSHVALIGDLNARAPGASRLVEVALDPLSGHGWAPRMNAVRVDTPLARYADPAYYPNIGILSLPPTDRSTLSSTLERFVKERGVTDCCELLLRWLAFAWGTGTAPNPLFEGHGLPSAVMLTRLLGSVGYDLSPGIADIGACPESIWQSARWWHEHHELQNQSRIVGQWHIEHSLSSYQSYRDAPGAVQAIPTVVEQRKRPALPALGYLK